jgi:predicted phage terminase large subunit-like protein
MTTVAINPLVNWSQAELLQASGELDNYLASLDREAAKRLLFDIKFWGRPKQIMPEGDYLTWLLMTGRGFGKNWALSMNLLHKIEHEGYRRIALVGRTVPDVRKTMIEGESGILTLAPDWFRPEYVPSNRELIFPNGAIATTYTAVEPDQLRGPQHDLAAVDELAAFRQVNGEQEAWSNLKEGLRIGKQPRIIATTTPRPTKFMRDLVKDDLTVVTGGHSDENKANLHPSWYSSVIEPLKGTRRGRQEAEGVLLEDVEGSLWQHDDIDRDRVSQLPPGVGLIRVVVAIDPAGGGGDEIGIIAAAKASDGHYYVLHDRSLFATPAQWGWEVKKLYDEVQADRVVAEKNYGGDMVEATIRNVEGGGTMSYKPVTASRGKAVRAEPVSALYERGLVHHVGIFPELEDQMTTWTPDSPDSPDRLDALVWAITDLIETASQGVW